ncbi:MAG TPA: hypothetical protein VG148_01125 [Pyrinomonadaceae bacterium]|nr:hypothetical protein [Pyrinomonadaceae bacterium]
MCLEAAASTLALLLAAAAPSHGQITISEINPDQSTLDANNPNGASGGRVNGLARAPGGSTTFYAASEWGGLFKSTDAGATWSRLNKHLPTVTWDVEVSPSNASRVVATSFYDGRISSVSGISVSSDGGANWTHPASANPPSGLCVDERRTEPSAFGIAFDPANSSKVYAGTNCGLARSTDGGLSWNFVDPTPGDTADDVWDVVVHHGGIIDICGDDGHLRSTDGGNKWTAASGTPLPSGRCSITASPDESYVLFAAVGTTFFESDDGGQNWVQRGSPENSPQGRIPFVTTNQRSGAAFDLWYGDVRLWRAGCATPATSPSANCRPRRPHPTRLNASPSARTSVTTAWRASASRATRRPRSACRRSTPARPSASDAAAAEPRRQSPPTSRQAGLAASRRAGPARPGAAPFRASGAQPLKKFAAVYFLVPARLCSDIPRSLFSAPRGEPFCPEPGTCGTS